MRVHVGELERQEAKRVICSTVKLSPHEERVFAYCISMSESLWLGSVDNKFACAWGLIPPSLMSYQAYLWLFTDNIIKGHEFLFVRHSQVQVQEMLKRYPTIVGHTDSQSTKTMRWLKWLGATFGEPTGKLVPFTIRKSNG